MTDNLWKLSPSDLTFLWDECQRCFYLKVAQNIQRPHIPFPKIFNRIDKLMKDCFMGRCTYELSQDLPSGEIIFAEKWVKSAPISFGNNRNSCYISGKFDSLIKFDDHSYGVVDFKTTEPRAEHVEFYSRQLHAYAYSLENPASNSLLLKPVSRLGLFCMEPYQMEYINQNTIVYHGKTSWLECPRDDIKFLNFLDTVLNLLEHDFPPEGNPECEWCRYRGFS